MTSILQVPRALETDRLILRRLRADDVEPFTQFLTDEESTRFMAFTSEQKTAEGAQAMVDWTIAAYDTDEPSYVLAITAKDDDTYMGSIGGAPDLDTDGTEIFYTLLSQFRGKGYAVEAVKRLIESLRVDNGVHRVVAYIMHGNDASIKVAEKIGMQLDGEVNREGHAGVRYVLDAET